MELYELRCVNEYGELAVHGYYRELKNAKAAKAFRDNLPSNKKYKVRHHIVKIETED